MGYTRTPDAAGRTKTIFLVNGFKNPALRAGHKFLISVRFQRIFEKLFDGIESIKLKCVSQFHIVDRAYAGEIAPGCTATADAIQGVDRGPGADSTPPEEH